MARAKPKRKAAKAIGAQRKLVGAEKICLEAQIIFGKSHLRPS